MRRLITALTVVALTVMSLALGTLPDEKEIAQKVLGPSVQIALFEGLGGATARWRVAGSGTVFKKNDKTYILTAGHVVEYAMREVKPEVEPDKPAPERKVVRFDDVMAIIQREKDGIMTAELHVRCRVLKFSPDEEKGGDDLAVLEPYEPELLPYSATALPKDKSPYIGQPVYHCGSMLGELVNSVTFGVISHTSRMLENKPFLQLSTTAQPGSSGGGIFVVVDDKCYFAGILTRGAGETINLAVPISRIRKALAKWGLDNILD
jgi:S1-C subfamily serine protease